MTRHDIIKHLEETKRILVEEISSDEITDCARENACIDIEDAIEILKENFEG